MKLECVGLDDRRSRYFIPKNDITRKAKAPIPICGVYFLVMNDEVVYVGQSRDVAYRIRQHQERKKDEFDRVFVVTCDPDMLACVEEAYISELKPKLNVQLRPFSTQGRDARSAVNDYWRSLKDEDDSRLKGVFSMQCDFLANRRQNQV